MSDFKKFSQAVNQKLKELSKSRLYKSSVDGSTLFEAYLAAFPKGTNNIFRERTHHDCSCCKNFIRGLGKVVTIDEKTGKLDSIWNVSNLEYPYDVVAKELHELVISGGVENIYMTKEHKYGAESTTEHTETGMINWDHFWGDVPKSCRSNQPSKALGEAFSKWNVLVNSLNKLSLDAIDQVIELIESNSLYRGEEHLASVKEFRKLKVNCKMNVETYAWLHYNSFVAHFKNTVIGTLVEDLSNSVDLEAAVRMFESKVAPANYKRPSALITPRMVENAMQTIRDLDLESSMQRRHAKLSDVSVNNVIWVDNQVKPLMKDGLESLLMQETKKTNRKVDFDKAIKIDIDKFMSDVVPKAKSMSAYVANEHQANLVSITTAQDQASKTPFKWSNNFAWSYNGNIADSDIKKRVKDAGGNVTNAQLRVSLSWFNYDDLDIHIHNSRGLRVYFGNRCNFGAELDVDMNAGGRSSREPVENISWVNVPDDVYAIKVNNFRKRESIDVGFVIEIENDGVINQYAYEKALADNDYAEVGYLKVKNGVIVDSKINFKNVATTSKNIWNVDTNTFVPVQTIMFSPNYWDDNAVGNKHWFFILEGCLNDEPTRGIYNEFLSSELDKHRKVFEILGDKTKCEVADEQLSGLGFSSTLKDRTLYVSVVDDKSTKLYNISFA